MAESVGTNQVFLGVKTCKHCFHNSGKECWIKRKLPLVCTVWGHAGMRGKWLLGREGTKKVLAFEVMKSSIAVKFIQHFNTVLKYLLSPLGVKHTAR